MPSDDDIDPRENPADRRWSVATSYKCELTNAEELPGEYRLMPTWLPRIWQRPRVFLCPSRCIELEEFSSQYAGSSTKAAFHEQLVISQMS